MGSLISPGHPRLGVLIVPVPLFFGLGGLDPSFQPLAKSFARVTNFFSDSETPLRSLPKAIEIRARPWLNDSSCQFSD